MIIYSPCIATVLLRWILTPKRIPGFSQILFIGTLRTKNLDPKQTKATIHSFRDATLEDLTITIQKYRPKQLHTLTLIAGFNDYNTNANNLTNNWRKKTNTIFDKFLPRFFFSQKLLALQIIVFINNQINNLNYVLYKLINSFIHPSILIVSPYFNLPFNHFCKDGKHFSFYGNQMFACYLTRTFEFFPF